jgi:hypothetical protein
MYLVKAGIISPASKVPLLSASKPYSTFTPPVAQFTPAASVVVFAKELNPLVPFVPFVPLVPLVPLVPAAPLVPSTPLQIYFVKAGIISPASKVPLLSASKPYSTFTPPVAQFTPAASVVVFAKELNPLVPFVPFVPLVPLVPLVPAAPLVPSIPLQMYLVKAGIISPASKVPLLSASKPYSTFTPPVAQLTPAASVVVFAKELNPLVPFVPFVPLVPLVPLVPAAPLVPSTPLQMYLVKAGIISPASKVPLLSASKPYSTFTPPVAQFTPAASVVVFAKELNPLVPFVPFVPLVPLVPLVPAAPLVPSIPLQMYLVKAGIISPASKVPLLSASKPYSTFTPPVAQLTPAASVVVFAKELNPLVPFVPLVPLVPLVPAAPLVPSTPLQMYLVKAGIISPASKVPLLSASKPYSTLTPPVAQLTPAASVVVFAKELNPLVPFVPFVPLVPLVPAAPLVPSTPLQMYLVKAGIISPASKVPLLSASKPYSTFTPPVAQFTPAASVVVFAKELNPLVPFVPFVPLVPLVPLVPAAPLVPSTPLQMYLVKAGIISPASKVHCYQHLNRILLLHHQLHN